MAGTTDTVKAMLTPGEFVIRKEAVDMIGVPILEKLNDMPEAGGHSEIDRLIGMATLKNMTGMYGGGNVEAYGHGGKVHGGLKPIPNNNPGLAKLPEGVRNKMGYMQDGGSVSDATATNLMEMLYEQSLPTQNNYGSLQDQDRIDRRNQEIMDMVTGSAGAVGRIAKPSKKAIEKFLKEYFNLPFTPKFNKTLPKIDFKGSPSQRDMAKFEYGRRKNIESQLDLYEDIPNMSQYKIQNAFELEDAGDMIDVLRKRGLFASGGLVGMMHGGEAKKKKKMYGYQEGGAVQEDAMMQQYLQSMEAQQPNSFVPFDQRPPSSGEVMSPIPRGMEQGDYYRSLRGELEMENEELVRDKAQNTLDRIRLDSLLNQGAERIERVPNDSSYFQNTPEQDYFMKKYREQMIDPMFLPQDN